MLHYFNGFLNFSVCQSAELDTINYIGANIRFRRLQRLHVEIHRKQTGQIKDVQALTICGADNHNYGFHYFADASTASVLCGNSYLHFCNLCSVTQPRELAAKTTLDCSSDNRGSRL